MNPLDFTDRPMPCGNCNIGVYDSIPIQNAEKLFAACLTVEDAIKLVPPCKSNCNHACYGAMDFIEGKYT